MAFASIALGCLAGCETGGPTYEIRQVELERGEAQRAIIGQALRADIKPPLDSPLKWVAMALPDYPREARRLGLEGRVPIAFCIETDGSVGELTVTGSTPPALAESAIGAVRQWRFDPPRRDGKPVRPCLQYEFQFVLR